MSKQPTHATTAGRVYLALRKAAIESLIRVANARNATLRSLASETVGYAALAQGKWAAWRRKYKLGDRIPHEFAQVLTAVVAFADPALQGDVADCTWHPDAARWSAG